MMCFQFSNCLHWYNLFLHQLLFFESATSDMAYIWSYIFHQDK